MNLIDSTGITLMLRAAKSDYQKARRQIPLGITVCVFVACVTGLFVWGGV